MIFPGNSCRHAGYVRSSRSQRLADAIRSDAMPANSVPNLSTSVRRLASQAHGQGRNRVDVLTEWRCPRAGEDHPPWHCNWNMAAVLAIADVSWMHPWSHPPYGQALRHQPECDCCDLRLVQEIPAQDPVHNRMQPQPPFRVYVKGLRNPSGFASPPRLRPSLLATT